MKPTKNIAMAIGVGYVLGRNHKLRAVLMLGSAVATGQLSRGPAKRLLCGDEGGAPEQGEAPKGGQGMLAKLGGPGKAAISKGMEKLKEGESPAGAALGAGVEGGKEQVKQVFGKGGGGDGGGDGDSGNKGKNDFEATNIIESIDVGVPVWLAYNQWTQFKDFPSFMKKVEDIEQDSEEKITWKAQVLWSHRKWDATIIEQVPDERIVWESKGDKGSVDGTVSFHELAPDLTRILVVMQYHSQGLVEKTGNLWRAPGRRVRLELKHFVRHVMTDTIMHPDDVKGWRGEIRDAQVVQESDESEGQDDQGGPEGKPDQPANQKPVEQDDEQDDQQADQESDQKRAQQRGDGRSPSSGNGNGRRKAEAGKAKPSSSSGS